MSAETTIAIILGASDFPFSPTLRPADGEGYVTNALKRAGQDFYRYSCVDEAGLRLPPERVLDLFDSEAPASNVNYQIADFLETHSTTATPRNLVLFYVGHGLILGNTGNFHLALNSTRESMESFTSIAFSHLAAVLRTQGAHYRKLLILDCCFGGRVFPELGPLENAVRGFVADELGEPKKAPEKENPASGTSALTAASRGKTALVMPHELYPMFSGQLLGLLRAGLPEAASMMTLSDIYEPLKERIRVQYGDAWVRPELQSPDQSLGDVGKAVALFPNICRPKAVHNTVKPEGVAAIQLPAQEKPSFGYAFGYLIAYYLVSNWKIFLAVFSLSLILGWPPNWTELVNEALRFDWTSTADHVAIGPTRPASSSLVPAATSGASASGALTVPRIASAASGSRAEQIAVNDNGQVVAGRARDLRIAPTDGRQLLVPVPSTSGSSEVRTRASASNVLLAEAREHVNWCFTNTGPAECPNSYSQLGADECLGRGNRSCLARKARVLVGENRCHEAFEMMMACQCHPTGGSGRETFLLLGESKVCELVATH